MNEREQKSSGRVNEIKERETKRVMIVYQRRPWRAEVDVAKEEGQVPCGALSPKLTDEGVPLEHLTESVCDVKGRLVEFDHANRYRTD